MDIFEKQQTIETIKTVVKARWFYVAIIILQGLMVRLFIKGPVLASNYILVLFSLGMMAFNFCYWIYLRQTIEKINTSLLKIIKAMQIIIDQLAIFGLFYFSGSVNKILVVSLYITLMVGSYLFEKKGILLSALMTSFLYCVLAIMEYFGFLGGYYGTSSLIQPTLKGDINMTKGYIIGFNFYFLSAVFFAVYLSGLFKSRERSLRIKTDEAVKKSNILSLQTEELTKTRDYLHEALTKSEKARKELDRARQELEKANSELMKKIEELEKYDKVTTGREVKMMELKEKIESLEAVIKKLEGEK